MQVPHGEGLKIEAFKTWLAQQGAEVLAPTNAYELVRFRARGGVHVVYTGRRGVSMPGFAMQAYQAFERGSRLDMGLVSRRRNTDADTKSALLARDGRACFFCLVDMPNDDMTIEHLVSLHKGGPNHQDNLALAHASCNRIADNLPLVKKFTIREMVIMAREKIKNTVDTN